MGNKFKIAANTFVQIIGRLLSGGTTFLITILVARQFGVEDYGEFTKIMTYVALFYLVADFGFNAIVVKQISEKEEETKNLFANILGLRIVGSLVLIFIALGVLSLLPYNAISNQGFSSATKLGVIIASLTILTQSLFTTANILFQKNLRYDFSVSSSTLGSLLILALVFAFTYLRAPFLSVVFAYLAGGILTVLLALNLSRRFSGGFRPAFDFAIWRKLFWQTLPLGATLIFNLIYFRADMIILAFLRPNAEVGVYGLAYKFFEFPLAIVTLFMNSVYPLILIRARGGQEELQKTIRKLITLLLLVSLPIAIVFIIFAPFLNLIQPGFSPSVLALRILSLSLPLFFLSSIFMWTLIALGKQKLLAIFYGVSMALNVLLNLVFIPHFGYLAAAVITGATELVVLLLTGASVFSFLTKRRESDYY